MRVDSRFQFTLPHRERPVKSNVEPSISTFQFTLPHRERPDALTGLVFAAAISIHAPAQGATVAAYIISLPRLFQFTLPHRERPVAAYIISLPRLFQFTLPHRERRLDRCQQRQRGKFQFTLPHRERRDTVLSKPSASFYFNSRSRTGSDYRRYENE